VIGGIWLRGHMDTMFTLCIAFTYFFLADVDAPPLAKPLVIVTVMRSSCRASSRILALFDMRDVYLLYFGCLCSLNLFPGRTTSILSFSGYLWSAFSALVVLWNSLSSFIYMNLVALVLSSSRSTTSFLHKQSTNVSGLKVVIRWCIATSGFKLLNI